MMNNAKKEQSKLLSRLKSAEGFFACLAGAVLYFLLQLLFGYDTSIGVNKIYTQPREIIILLVSLTAAGVLYSLFLLNGKNTDRAFSEKMLFAALFAAFGCMNGAVPPGGGALTDDFTHVYLFLIFAAGAVLYSLFGLYVVMILLCAAGAVISPGFIIAFLPAVLALCAGKYNPADAPEKKKTGAAVLIISAAAFIALTVYFFVWKQKNGESDFTFHLEYIMLLPFVIFMLALIIKYLRGKELTAFSAAALILITLSGLMPALCYALCGVFLTPVRAVSAGVGIWYALLICLYREESLLPLNKSLGKICDNPLMYITFAAYAVHGAATVFVRFGG